MYILVALGFAFLFSLLGILNFAHGAIYMIGGYIGFQFAVVLGLNQWVSLIISAIIVAALGVFLERFCFRPFVGNFNSTVMVCVAITLILQTTINIFAGYKTQALPPFVPGYLKTGAFSISYERITTFIIGIILLGIIIWIVKKTKYGQQMQAVAQNMEGASLQGISIHRISVMTCALGCGLAAIAGCLMGAYLNLSPFMGDFMLVKALILVMLAGIGSIGGVFIAGFILGSLDAVLPMLISGAASDATVTLIVIILLLIRPKGFFGHEA